MNAASRLFVLSILLASGALPVAAHVGEPCTERVVAASAVSTQSDIRAFVDCAAAYIAEHGTAEARRAFNEDKRWNHGSIYVFVDGIAPPGENALVYVYPPDPSIEGGVWGTFIDTFGTDYYHELYRMMSVVDSGWIYYSIVNPASGQDEPKSSYVIEVDWDGERAAVGAGVYLRDWPGTCYEDEVSAGALQASPNEDTLREFVRCASMLLESDGYFAMDMLEGDARWTDGGHYVLRAGHDGQPGDVGQPRARQREGLARVGRPGARQPVRRARHGGRGQHVRRELSLLPVVQPP